MAAGKWALWRMVKYEDVHLKTHAYTCVSRKELGDYFRFYNDLSPHQALSYRTPAEVFHGEHGVGEGEFSVKMGSLGNGSIPPGGAPGISLNSAPILPKLWVQPHDSLCSPDF